MNKKIKLIALTMSLAFAGLTAQANTITPAFVNVTPAGGGLFNWNYTITMVNSTFNNGSGGTLQAFFTINDFGPVVSASPIAGFTFSQSLLGPNGDPGAVGLIDIGSILNASYSWTGANGTAIPTGTTLAFTLQSTLSLSQLGDYTSQDNTTVPPAGESHAHGTIVRPMTVPDGGSSVALLGLALTGIEGARRMMRARKA